MNVKRLTRLLWDIVYLRSGLDLNVQRKLTVQRNQNKPDLIKIIKEQKTLIL